MSEHRRDFCACQKPDGCWGGPSGWHLTTYGVTEAARIRRHQANDLARSDDPDDHAEAQHELAALERMKGYGVAYERCPSYWESAGYEVYRVSKPECEVLNLPESWAGQRVGLRVKGGRERIA